MKKFISKTGIILTLIFSFLLSFFATNDVSVNASSITVGQDVVNVISIEREGNNIVFKTKDKLSVIELTYEVCYMNGTIKEGDLITTKEFTKIDDYTYEFYGGDTRWVMEFSEDYKNVKLDEPATSEYRTIDPYWHFVKE